MTARVEQVKGIRYSILELAVRGKLAEQDERDEPTTTLLLRVAEQQSELVRKRALKRDGGALRLSDGDAPFEIPPGCQWATLRGLIVFGPHNGLSPRPSTRPDAPRAVTLTATTKGFDPSHFKRVEATVPDDSEYWLRPDDLLFQRGNTRAYVGMAAPYIGEPGIFLYPDLMMRVRMSSHVDLRAGSPGRARSEVV
jgi:type I restriction enzyme S subunit